MKNILVTGGAGFIGSNFIDHLLNNDEKVKVINLDLLTYAGDLKNLQSVSTFKNYTFIQGDINNRKLVESLFQEYKISDVIHFAAESHVDNSITGPDIFIKTNINGTFSLLDIAYKFWMNKPFEFKEEFEYSRFHHISTDEVYGSLGEEGLFTEKTAYAPNSPYSASKAASDMIVRSYHHTYGMNTIITNCSNNYGPKQHLEKLIPTIINCALTNKKIPIYGDGKNIRDWLYVIDHCKGIKLAFEKGVSGETYNIGGKNEKTNLDIVRTICEIMDELRPQTVSYKELISFVDDRPGHDRRYAIDATKIENELSWKADEDFNSGILKTIEWYLGELDGK